MSWKPEVRTVSDGDKWMGNALRFANREEAEANVSALMSVWYAVTETRVVESSDPVNYKWIEGKGLVSIHDADTEPVMPAERVKI